MDEGEKISRLMYLEEHFSRHFENEEIEEAKEHF